MIVHQLSYSVLLCLRARRPPKFTSPDTLFPSTTLFRSVGEANQLTAQRKIYTSEEQYLDIIGAKTAALFAVACRISAVVADRDEAEEQALDVYGRNLGIAFHDRKSVV